MTPFEKIVRDVTAQYRESKGLPPLASDITIPASIRKDTDRDTEPPDEDTSGWPDDHKADDPRRGQAKHINKGRIF